jgi:putative ABC transport system permease protein
MPLYNSPGTTDFEVEGRPPRQSGERMTAGSLITTMPDFLDATGIALLEGRYFTSADHAGAEPVTVVSRNLADTYFPGESALGKRIRIAGDAVYPWLTIVGVVAEAKYSTLQETPYPRWYIPFVQAPVTVGFTPRGMTMVLRTAGDETSFAPAIRNVVRELDPRLPVIRMASMETVRSESVARPRFTLSLFGVFAAVALLLGAIGLYGLLSFSVTERSREVGIRRALGARSAGVLGLIVVQGLRLTAGGVLLGLAVAFAVTRLMEGLLFGVTPNDPLTYAGVTVTLALVALAATLVPAARAARLDPMRVLRD